MERITKHFEKNKSDVERLLQSNEKSQSTNDEVKVKAEERFGESLQVGADEIEIKLKELNANIEVLDEMVNENLDKSLIWYRAIAIGADYIPPFMFAVLALCIAFKKYGVSIFYLI